MNKEMKDLATWCMEVAQSAGSDASRIRLESSRAVEISYRERKAENIKEASQKSISIEIFTEGRYSSQKTSDLRKPALKKFIGDAIESTRRLGEDPYRSLPDPQYFQNRIQKDLMLFDQAYLKYTPEERHQLTRTIEDATRRFGGEQVVSVSAYQEDGREETFLITSNGCEGYEDGTYFVAGGTLTLQDEGDRRPRGYYYAVTLNRKEIPSPELIGREIVRRTRDLMGGKKIKTETLPIIVENRVAEQLLDGFIEAMYGWNVQQKRSFLTGKKGQPVGSPLFTLIDDPLLVKGLGSQLFDSDGISRKRRVMVEAGMLQEYYVDWYYARKLGWEPTSGSVSNLIIPPGKRTVNEIMKDIGRGIYITSFIGGNSNSTTGDFSIGIIGKLFENGEPVQSVAEMNIAGNHLEFWKKLIEAADDPWPYARYRLPSLVFQDVVVSGI